MMLESDVVDPRYEVADPAYQVLGTAFPVCQIPDDYNKFYKSVKPLT